ncbi:MAG: ferritin-like domain-containing protein [Polyangiaceae bacterium]|nr:ferritin-like domain-containing protein [Polyangiaceae bacterium]
MERALGIVRTSIFAAVGIVGCSAPDAGRQTSEVDIETPPTSTATLTTATPREPPKGKGWVKEANGIIHRASEATCSAEIATPACEGNENHMSCKSDSECTEHPHGKCVHQTGAPMRATYCNCDYSCASDADCAKDEVCVCGDTSGQKQSKCAKAACKTDADCPSGTCALSAYFNGCHTALQLACKSDTDACKADADCTGGTHCVFASDGKTESWQCRGMGCVIGRPLVVDDEVQKAPNVERSDWAATEGLEGRYAADPDAADLRAHWLEIAAMEHASIASFARFALELLTLGAPPGLLVKAQAAMADETRHAQLAYSIALEYGGCALGPGKLEAAVAPMDATVYRVAYGLVRDGCIGETFGAVEGRCLAAVAVTPERRDVLDQIAEDELSHAMLAFEALRWMVATFGDDVRAAARDALAQAREDLATMSVSSRAARSEHGVFPASELKAMRLAALETIVEPALSASSSTRASLRCAS